jgi:hypothetical protein
MRIRDLVVLGRACPEKLKDGRVTVCLAGWSQEFGFVRLYPTRVDFKVNQWDVVDVEVERNNQDTRIESYKIVGSQAEWANLSKKITKVGEVSSVDERRQLVHPLSDTCVNVINNAKRSLGIVRPSKIHKTYFADNKMYHETFQMALPAFTEHDFVKGKRDFSLEPRIAYTCPACTNTSGEHDQQILEWGIYEWLRKFPDNPEQVWENAHFNDPDYDMYLFVGNQARHRTSFMVISVIRMKSGTVQPTFLSFRKLPDDAPQEDAP